MYVVRGWQSGEGEGWLERPTVVVWEEEEDRRDTGLVDERGVKIWRVKDKVRMGFHV